MDFVSDRGDHPLNEDIIGWSGAYAWVIDGASPIGSQPWIDPVSDANWLAVNLDICIRTALLEGRGPSETLKRAITLVSLKSPKVPNSDVLVPSASAALIKCSSRGLDYVALGDVTVVAVNRAGAILAAVQGEVTDYDSRQIKHIARLTSNGLPYQDARKFVFEEMLMDRKKYMNKPGGYWTVSLDASVVDHAETGQIESEIVEIFLLTDGFRRFDQIYQLAPDLKSAIDLFRKEGLRHGLKEIRRVETEDSDGARHHRISVTDDASAARLQVIR